MGGMGFLTGRGRMNALFDILNGYNYIVVSEAVNYNKEVKKDYILLNKYNEKEIKQYVIQKAEDFGLKLTKIKIYSLLSKLEKEIKL